VAIIDWASRAVPAWRLSNTMDVAFCVDALDEALARFGRPEIFNTDQGSQFTSAAFTGRLTSADIRISMDGRGRWMDNVFIERLWRSLKSEDVYLKGYADGREARAGITLWIGFYKGRHPHQALAGRTPMAVWREGVSGALAGNAVDMSFAWTTLPRRPHAHRDHSSNRRLEWRDRQGQSRPACQSGTMVQWSHQRGPLHDNPKPAEKNSPRNARETTPEPSPRSSPEASDEFKPASNAPGPHHPSGPLGQTDSW